MFRWLASRLYRKLLLSYIGILFLSIILTGILGTIIYHLHIQGLFQDYMTLQTRILSQHLRDDLNKHLSKAPKTSSPPATRQQNRTSPPATRQQNRTSPPATRQQNSASPPATRQQNNASPPVTRQQKRASVPRTPPKRTPHLSTTQQKQLQSLLPILRRRTQEAALVLYAVVTVRLNKEHCLLVSYPAELADYFHHHGSHLPLPSRQRLPQNALSRAAFWEPPNGHCPKPGRGRRHRHKKLFWKFSHPALQGVTLTVHYHLLPFFFQKHPPRALISSFLLVFVLIGLLLVPVSRSITKPLQNLTDRVRQIQQGDLSEPITSKGHDEVTRLTQSVEEMRQSLLRLSQQRRSLLSDASHEIRTPLTRIRTVAESVADGLMREDPPLTQAMEGICKQIDEINQLIEDMMELSRFDLPDIRRMEYTRFEVAPFLKDVNLTFGPAAEAEQVRLQLISPPKAIPLQADQRRLRQVINNLLQNAIRYSPPQGQVTLQVQQQEESLRFEVCDEGPGIPPEERERIFERLYRIDRSRARQTGGQGLGLAIARQIVEAHHGEIGVHDASGHGACFWFTLPLQPPS